MNQRDFVKLSFETWSLRANDHYGRISPIADAFLHRRAIGKKNPVNDFLFTYYNCSPAKLKQWVPSYREILELTPDFQEQFPWFLEEWFFQKGSYLYYKTDRIKENHIGLANFIANLCKSILERKPRFCCYGMHEWAMLYKAPPNSKRHEQIPLRVSHQELDHFVESQKICCTHYDAFRFFTNEALPLNVFKPTLESRLNMEQSGCLHANMDLYKWSCKLWPWIGSDFLSKTFFLALQGRILDMRASPYDLSTEGYKPICIETEEGRRLYQHEQQTLSEYANELRAELYHFCNEFIENNGVKEVDADKIVRFHTWK